MKQYKISVSWKGQVLDSIIMGLCKTQQTSRAIDFLAYMVENGCKPTEATYNILVKGITCEGLPEEASKLWSELYSKGPVKKSLVEKIKVKMQKKTSTTTAQSYTVRMCRLFGYMVWLIPIQFYQEPKFQ